MPESVPGAPSAPPGGAPGASGDDKGRVGEALDLVKAYVRQETVGPLKGIGRWVAFGIAGSLLLALGMLLVLLGVLRLLQAEVTALDGSWSWAPYGIVLVLCVALTALAVTRVKKNSLGKER